MKKRKHWSFVDDPYKTNLQSYPRRFVRLMLSVCVFRRVSHLQPLNHYWSRWRVRFPYVPNTPFFFISSCIHCLHQTRQHAYQVLFICLIIRGFRDVLSILVAIQWRQFTWKPWSISIAGIPVHGHGTATTLSSTFHHLPRTVNHEQTQPPVPRCPIASFHTF